MIILKYKIKTTKMNLFKFRKNCKIAINQYYFSFYNKI